MAIDARNRRASALGLPPAPDGSLASANDRRQLAGLYRIGAEPGEAPRGPSAFGSVSRRRGPDPKQTTSEAA